MDVVEAKQVVSNSCLVKVNSKGDWLIEHMIFKIVFKLFFLRPFL